MFNRGLRPVVIAFLASSVFTVATERIGLANPQATRAHIIREVRHELATLPYYGVFDWLEFEVGADNSVVLRGQVIRPTTKSEAEARVKEIDSVSRVVNEIQVLPPSPQDDRLRLA